MAGDDAPEKNEEEKDSELDLLAEQELVRLTRQFRVMEGDKEVCMKNIKSNFGNILIKFSFRLIWKKPIKLSKGKDKTFKNWKMKKLKWPDL